MDSSFFFTELTIFALAAIVGYYVVWRVTPALHAPLMAVTNAISSVVVVGALLLAASGDWLAATFGVIATFLTAINIVGGFYITKRMLSMFQKKSEEQKIHKNQAFQRMALALFLVLFVFFFLVGSGEGGRETGCAVSGNFRALLPLMSGISFILALHYLSHPKTALQGYGAGVGGILLAALSVHNTAWMIETAGMTAAVGVTPLGGWLGWVITRRIPMTALPQLLAAFHSLVGLAAVLIAAGALAAPADFGILRGSEIATGSLVEMGLGTLIGAITLSGSLVAFGKLHGLLAGVPLRFPGRHAVNVALGCLVILLLTAFVIDPSQLLFWLMVVVAVLLGAVLIWGIGGADMPVIVSMLNSYSGWAACGIGFTLHNTLLIMTGALVGASGAILSYVMCRGMNRSLLSVVLGGYGTSDESLKGAAQTGEKTVREGSAEDAAFLLQNARDIIIVPGYGMAVSGAQHAVKELVSLLQEEGIRVRFAIHPVAGRMPGHMNVLLAEAGISYEDVLELEEINRDFAGADVALVLGAKDVTNPAAKTDTSSPIYGMPILNVGDAKTVLFSKRSMASGYAGVDNPLFYQENTMMLFGDAKKMVEQVIRALSEAHS